MLDSASDKTFCERQLFEKFSSKSHRFSVELAVQTMMCRDTELLDTCVVSLNIHSLDSSYSLNLLKVVVVDYIPVAPSLAPTQKVISKYPHLADTSLPIVDGASVTL